MRAPAIEIGPNNPYVGFGAGARDLYMPVMPAVELPQDYKRGDPITLPDGDIYIPGGKLLLGSEDMGMIEALENDPDSIKSVGGNIINVMTFLASHGIATRFVGALGTQDKASEAIRGHLTRFGIENAAVAQEGYQPSYSRIRRLEGQPREIAGAPRTPILEAVNREAWDEHLQAAGAIGASSLNSLELNTWILQGAPENAKIFYNPGGSEFKKYGNVLINLMHRRVRDGKDPVTKLALNETEMLEMHGLNPRQLSEKRLRELAEDMTRGYAGGVATRVLCTMDKEGFIIAENGDSKVYKADVIEKPEDTTAAGDTSNAAGQKAMMEGKNPDQSADDIREAGATCVQHIGTTYLEPYALAR